MCDSRSPKFSSLSKIASCMFRLDLSVLRTTTKVNGINGKLGNSTPSSLSPKPLNRWPLNLAWVMTSGSYPCAKFHYDTIRSYCSPPRPVPARAGGYKVTRLVCWPGAGGGFWRRCTVQPSPLHRFSRSIRQMTFRARMYLLGVPKAKFYISTPFAPKAHIFGQFFRSPTLKQGGKYRPLKTDGKRR